MRASGTVEALREIKDAGELALLRLACEAADAALGDLLDRGGLRPGRTEREVARELEALMLDHGADAVSFETIVAAGPNSAIPHHRPTDAVLATGDFVKIDFGALVAGYHSDMTRTFVLGKAADWQLEIYQLVADAQRAGREALAPGVGLRDVDAAARQLIADAGYAEQFRPRSGTRRGPGDPRSAGNRRDVRRDTARGFGGDGGARRLSARSRRCAHRGHAGRAGWHVGDGPAHPGIADPVPQGTDHPDLSEAVRGRPDSAGAGGPVGAEQRSAGPARPTLTVVGTSLGDPAVTTIAAVADQLGVAAVAAVPTSAELTSAAASAVTAVAEEPASAAIATATRVRALPGGAAGSAVAEQCAASQPKQRCASGLSLQIHRRASRPRFAEAGRG